MTDQLSSTAISVQLPHLSLTRTITWQSKPSWMCGWPEFVSHLASLSVKALFCQPWAIGWAVLNCPLEIWHLNGFCTVRFPFGRLVDVYMCIVFLWISHSRSVRSFKFNNTSINWQTSYRTKISNISQHSPCLINEYKLLAFKRVLYICVHNTISTVCDQDYISQFLPCFKTSALIRWTHMSQCKHLRALEF